MMPVMYSSCKWITELACEDFMYSATSLINYTILSGLNADLW